MRNLKQGCNERVAFCLFDNAMPCIHQYYGGICSGSSRDHISSILNMSWGVCNDKFSLGSGKIPVSYINGNPLFPFITQPISEQCQIHTVMTFLFACAFYGSKLIFKYRF